MRPACFDRPARAPGAWMPTGRIKWGEGKAGIPGVKAGYKPVVRWVPRFSEDRCATHDGTGIGPKGESYPVAHGFDCAGCRWEPAKVKQAREFDRMMLVSTPSGRNESIFERLAKVPAEHGMLPIKVLTELPVDNAADNSEVIPSLREQIIGVATEHYARTGQPVRLTCGDQTVGYVGLQRPVSQQDSGE